MTIESDESALLREVARVRSSGVLGESRLRLLFDYLVDRSLAGEAPKEIAIAVDVFGKNGDFDVAQDAVVRVYVHKLRKALGSFYADAEGTPNATSLSLPRGEYRLRLSTNPSALERKSLRWGAVRPSLGAALLLGAGVLLGLGAMKLRTPRSELDLVRASPLWSSILADDRPIMIVVGDYYLIGETDSSMDVKRLIREFSVNSKSDLDDYIVQHPEVAARYMDVGLRYLPISTAFALRNVMAVLAPGNRRIVVSKMSDVEAGSLKSADIIYIGYISGMGMMQDLVFSGSRFEVGDSYDEVVDKQTKHSYISQTWTQIMDPPQSSGSGTSYHDYGLFMSLRGPGGNPIVVISGTRDEGVEQTAETFTSSKQLQELAPPADVTMPFEALLEVSAFDGVNLSGKLLLQSKRD
jgi:hypothetical protein